MIHWRVSFSIDVWYHIVASSDVNSIAVRPNGMASIFMQSDKAPKSNQTHFVVLGSDDIPGGTTGDEIAMRRAIEYLEKNVVGKQKINIVRF